MGCGKAGRWCWGCWRRWGRDRGVTQHGRDSLGQPRPTSTDIGQLPLGRPGRAPLANLGRPQPTSIKSAEGPLKCSDWRFQKINIMAQLIWFAVSVNIQNRPLPREATVTSSAILSECRTLPEADATPCNHGWKKEPHVPECITAVFLASTSFREGGINDGIHPVDEFVRITFRLFHFLSSKDRASYQTCLIDRRNKKSA
ncbi:hypothetical protein C8R44DRAFT_731258 [Mycena epipterygia]|nr:hypothetical protein C8R44DRAFT_731258 [Mycena epipterygia]